MYGGYVLDFSNDRIAAFFNRHSLLCRSRAGWSDEIWGGKSWTLITPPKTSIRFEADTAELRGQSPLQGNSAFDGNNDAGELS